MGWGTWDPQGPLFGCAPQVPAPGPWLTRHGAAPTFQGPSGPPGPGTPAVDLAPGPRARRGSRSAGPFGIAVLLTLGFSCALQS